MSLDSDTNRDLHRNVLDLLLVLASEVEALHQQIRDLRVFRARNPISKDPTQIRRGCPKKVARALIVIAGGRYPTAKVYRVLKNSRSNVVERRTPGSRKRWARPCADDEPDVRARYKLFQTDARGVEVPIEDFDLKARIDSSAATTWRIRFEKWRARKKIKCLRIAAGA